MKAVILYSSHQGYALECAKQIAVGLEADGNETRTVEIKREAKGLELADYDTVIVGGGIHAGHLSGALRKFCSQNEALLRTKRLGLFICGTDKDNQEKQFVDNFPQSLLDVAVAKGWFGGKIIFAEQKGIMRFVLKKMLKGENDVHEERPEAVKTFLNEMA